MKKTKIVAALLSTVLVASTFLTACGNANSGTGTTGEATTEQTESTEAETASASGFDLSVSVGPEPDTIDPTLNSASDVSTMLHHAFEGLMATGEDGAPKQGQAEKYEVSEDGLTYTFTLRDGLKWSDGTPLTANDFVYSWNRAVNPDTAADYAYMFEVVEGYETGTLNVTAVDDKTLQVKLIAVTPYFLELCAFPTYMPVQQATVEANGETWAVDAATYISNGPYAVSEWVHDSYILMNKNPNYWDAASIGPDSIKFVLMEDDGASLSAYETGEVSMIKNLPNDELQSLMKMSDYRAEPLLSTYYISYNTTNEFLKDPLVRKAMTLAIDRDFICKEIGQSGQVPAGGFVSDGLFDVDSSKEFREVAGDYFDPLDYTGNLELAKAALKEAGYENGEGLPIFEYIYNDTTLHEAVAEALQDMWGKLGIQVELVKQEWGTFLNTRKEGEYDIARNGWTSDYNDPISFLDMWITGGGNNDAQWSNAEYDALISKVKASSDQTERMTLMHEAEDIIFDEWMLGPIYYYVDPFMIKDDIKGFYSTSMGDYYFMYTSK